MILENARFFPVLVGAIITGLASPSANQAAAFQIDKLPTTEELRTLRKKETTLQILSAESKLLFKKGLVADGETRKALFKKCYDKLVEATTKDPSLEPAGVTFAKYLITAGDKKSAAEQLRRTTIEHPEDPGAFVILANIALTEGRLTNSRLMYNEAERLIENWETESDRKQTLEIQVAAGRCTLHQQFSARLKAYGKQELADEHTQFAIAYIQHWEKLEPESTKPHIQLAQVHLNRKDYQAAEQAYRTAAELDSNLIDTDLWMGNFFVNQGDQAEALRRIETAVEQSPKNETVRMMAGGLFLSLHMPEKAIKEIEAALSINPKSRSTLFLKAQYYRFQQNWEEAIEILQELNSEDPVDFETSNLLSLTLTEQTSKEELLQAIALATVNTKKHPDATTTTGRRAYIALCWAFHIDKQTDKARNVLNQLLKVGIRSDKIRSDEAFFVARLLNEFNQPQLAIPLLKNILQRKTSFAKKESAKTLLQKLEDAANSKSTVELSN